MRVGIDATSWTNRRGFGRFTRSAVARLVALDPGTQYVLFTDAESAGEFDVPAGASLVAVTLGERPTVAASAQSNRSVRDLLRMTRAVARADLSAFVFPSLYTWFPVVRVPTVVGVHDLIAERLPELTLPSRRTRAAWQLKQQLAVRTATRVFTVSRASQDELATRFRRPAAQFAIVPEAPGEVFSPRSPAAVRSALDGIGLPADGRFLAFAGGISPHKGLDTLLDAYAAAVAARSDAPALVIAGDADADAFLSASSSLVARIAELGLRDRVLLPGYVSDEQLACLYAGAEVVVLPSRAEGFGLPAVEAAACGAAVLLSDLPAHRETLDGVARFFAVGDHVGLADGLLALLSDPATRAELGAGARARVGALSWDAAATALRDVIGAAAGAR